MDRKIPRATRVCLLAGTAVLAAVLILSTQTWAQEGRFGGGRGGGGFRMPTPEETFGSLDSDGDGRLTSDEINANRFVSRMFRETDTSNGMSRDQFLGEMNRIRENWSRGGPFGGGPGGPGGPGRGDGERRRDRGRDDDSDRRSDENRESRPDDSNNSGDNSHPEAGATESSGETNAEATPSTKSRPRITVDLQQDLVPADTDGDGQLGLYEWRRSAGRSLREFQQLDLNEDGFVTPREVAIARPEAAAPTTLAATTTTATTQPQSTPGAPAAATPSATGTQPTDPRVARDAERFFRLLDKNNDKQIAPDEWVDGRIRTMFTSGGIDLSVPLTAADFSSHYARLNVQ